MRVTNIHIFFFNDTATTEIYTLSLHDALPIWRELSTSLHFASSRFFSWKRLLAGCLRLQRWRSRSCSDATSGTLHSRPTRWEGGATSCVRRCSSAFDPPRATSRSSRSLPGPTLPLKRFTAGGRVNCNAARSARSDEQTPELQSRAHI